MISQRVAKTGLWTAGVAAVLRLLAQPRFAAAQAAVPTDARQQASLKLAARIDHHLAARWAAVGVKPAAPATDAQFFRRVHLDLVGRIPSIVDARDFIDD